MPIKLSRVPDEDIEVGTTHQTLAYAIVIDGRRVGTVRGSSSVPWGGSATRKGCFTAYGHDGEVLRDPRQNGATLIRARLSGLRAWLRSMAAAHLIPDADG